MFLPAEKKVVLMEKKYNGEKIELRISLLRNFRSKNKLLNLLEDQKLKK